jgi:ABC-type nitrate/sulfonate/bicarbonate transport system permease component
MRWLWRCVVLVACVGGWQLWASAAGSSFFPPPSAIVARMYRLWFSGPATHLFLTPDATGNILPSLGRVLAGLAIATATVDPQHLETGRAFRLSVWQRLVWVIIPAALPKAFAGFRLSLSLSLILMVFAELVGSSNGIGYEMSNASNSFDMTFLWSTIVLLGILGYLLNALLGGAERLVLSWHTDKGQD